MKIAVLMSTYNGHNFLDKQLESLANQTVAENMTVYIRDDESSDDTFDIIDKWKKALNLVLYKEKNVGPAMSFWKLLMSQEIQADYYAFCDQDDVWNEDKLETGIKALDENTHLYACNCRIIDENGLIVKEKRLDTSPEIDVKRLFVSGCTQGCSMIFDDSLRKYVQSLDLKCIPMHDVILMIHALSFGNVQWDDTPHFGYRVHSNNVVAKNNKTVFQNLKTTLWNWKNSSKNSMATVAQELIASTKNLKKDDLDYLICMRDYKKNIVSKWKIFTAYNRTSGISKKVLRSYKIRILLNLL